jgi:sodium pump decarboxylase gamma subunit
MLFNETMTIGEKFINSLAITILGMTVVFTVLVIIAYSIDMLRILLGDKQEKKKSDENELIKVEKDNNIAPNNSKAEVDTDLIAVLSAAIAAQNTDEILAVLTAAVLAQSGKSTEEIFIKSIVPIKQKSSIWAAAGRQEQMLKTI